jgi:hypothetical protein
LNPETDLKAFETSSWSVLLHADSTNATVENTTRNMQKVFISCSTSGFQVFSLAFFGRKRTETREHEMPGGRTYFGFSSVVGANDVNFNGAWPNKMRGGAGAMGGSSQWKLYTCTSGGVDR